MLHFVSEIYCCMYTSGMLLSQAHHPLKQLHRGHLHFLLCAAEQAHQALHLLHHLSAIIQLVNCQSGKPSKLDLPYHSVTEQTDVCCEIRFLSRAELAHRSYRLKPGRHILV